MVDWDSPMFGRDRELAQLQSALAKTRTGHGRTILISGEAGVGKTRLVNEFLAAASEALILRGWCLPRIQEPLLPIREALRSAGLEDTFAGIRPPRLISLFLVNAAGILIARAERQESGLDADIFTGMLTAVSTFVQDSLTGMGAGSDATLNRMGYGDYAIILETRADFSLVSIVAGDPNERFLADIQTLLDEILQEHQGILATWNGDQEEVQAILEVLQHFCRSDRYHGSESLEEDPLSRQASLFDNIALGMRRISRDQPVILHLDDLQWADSSTLGILHHLARSSSDLALFITGTYRSEEILDRNHPLRESISLMEREDLVDIIQLPRLEIGAIKEIISFSFPGLADSDQLSSRVFAETEGNAFFAHEILKLLCEEQILRKAGDRWVIDRSLDEIGLSPKMVEVIERRLRRLPEDDRQMLQCAATVGLEFTSGVVACTLDQQGITTMQRLDAIERLHSLILAIEQRYRFDHAKIREVLYSSLPDDLKRAYHAGIAECYLAQHRDDPMAVKFELAYHFDEAGDPRAAHYARAAGDAARADFSNRLAIKQYRVALKHIEDEAGEDDILRVLGKTLTLEQRYRDAVLAFDQILAMDPKDRGWSRIFECRIFCHGASEERGDYTPEITTARTRFDRSSSAYIDRTFMLAREHMLHSRFDAAKSTIEELFDLPAAAIWTLARVHNALGLIAGHRHDLAGAVSHFETGCRLPGIEDYPELAIMLGLNSGEFLVRLGRIREGLELFNRAADWYRAQTSWGHVIWINHQISIALEMGGDLSAAISIQQESLAAVDHIESRQDRGQILASLALLFARKGDQQVGLACIKDSLRIQRLSQDPTDNLIAHSNLAEILLEQGNLVKAQEEAGIAFELATELENLYYLHVIRMIRARIAYQEGEDWETDLAAAMTIPTPYQPFRWVLSEFSAAEMLANVDVQRALGYLWDARRAMERWGNQRGVERAQGILERIGCPGARLGERG